MFAPSKRSDAMKLKISFDDIAPAFEQASDSSLHMFIDTKENRIVVLSDNEATDADFEIMKRPRYVALPRRDSKDDYFRMESFTYVMSCCDLELVQKFHKALRQNKPFGNFRDLLSQHLEIEQQWFAFEKKAARNDAIDWLCEEGIELEGQRLIPEIEIRELDEESVKKLPDEIRVLKARACLQCHNESGLEARLFAASTQIVNAMIENEIYRILKDKYSLSEYAGWSDDSQTVLVAAKCPKCGSEEIFFDY